MPKIGPYSRPASMAKIDGRSADGRFLRRVRAELAQHVGGKPSATQYALIDRIAWLRLRIAAMDGNTALAKPMTEHDSRTYLAWVGTLDRLMRGLGPAVPLPDAKPATLKELLAQRQAAAAVI